MDLTKYLENKEPRGHNHIGTCRSCGVVVQWRRNKVMNHVLRYCTSASEEEQQIVKRFRGNGSNASLPLLAIAASNNDSEVSSATSSQLASPSRKLTMDRWIDTVNSDHKEKLDEAIAKFYYRTAIPFNTADCKEWKDVWLLARPAYEPPSSKRLRTTLLTKAFNKMQCNVNEIIQDATSVSVVSDGWSNLRNEHLVNFILIIPNHKPLFYGFIDCDGQSQTSLQIANDLIKVIEEIGAAKINSVVTDNANTMQGAWNIIEQKFPHIFCNGCAAHVLNLLIQDICSMDGNEDIINKATMVAKFIKSRSALSVAFRKAQQNYSFKRFLRLPVKTRWYTQYECLVNLVGNEEIIQQISATINIMRQYKNCDKFDEFIATVKDTNFWDRCRRVISKIILPSKLIGEAESDHTFLSKIYDFF